MSDEGGGRRDKVEPGIQFRYDRARRLERAGEGARWLDRQRGAKRPGILGLLTATRSSRILLLTILGFAAWWFLSPALRSDGAEASTSLASYSAKAMAFEGRVLVSLERRMKAEPGPAPGTGTAAPATFSVESRLAPAGGSERGAGSRSFAPAGERIETFRFALEPGEGAGAELTLVITEGGKRVVLLCPVE